MDVGFHAAASRGQRHPTQDAFASQGLNLTSAYSQPSCSPTLATIMTGQLPVHHGRVSAMYGQAGASKAVTLPSSFRPGLRHPGRGQRHMGETEGSQPQTSARRFGLPVRSDMYTEWRDIYYIRNRPNPARFAILENVDFNHNDVHS